MYLIKQADYPYSRTRMYLSGNPLFDTIYYGDYTGSTSDCCHSVLYTPRWNHEDGTSSFSILSNVFIEMANKYPNVEFVFRPHPLMERSFSKSDALMEDWLNFIQRIENNSNTFMDTEPDYLLSFKRATILISDYSSLLTEFLLTGKPVIYFHKKYIFNSFGEYISNGFYVCSDEKQVEGIMHDLLNGNDPKKALREEVIKKGFYFGSTTAVREIRDYLINDYTALANSDAELNECPLVSIIVLSYRNVNYLNECLDSIFMQTYENIELIISNDGADEFDRDAVLDFVNKAKPVNIRNVIVNKNERNYGTVKHCNVALDLSNGTHVMFIACDDAYNNSNAVIDMVKGFRVASPDTMSIVGQTGMYDASLKKCIRLYVDTKTQKLINALPPNELYKNHLVLYPHFPAASRIYKREAFEKYGKFDEKYFIVEDWSSSISHAKKGMKSYYVNVMCVNHRDGGVSHSTHDPNSFSQKMFISDLIAICEETLQDSSIKPDILEKVKQKQLGYTKLYNSVWG